MNPEFKGDPMGLEVIDEKIRYIIENEFPEDKEQMDLLFFRDAEGQYYLGTKKIQHISFNQMGKLILRCDGKDLFAEDLIKQHG